MKHLILTKLIAACYTSFAQNVHIPDPQFKTFLLGALAINTIDLSNNVSLDNLSVSENQSNCLLMRKLNSMRTVITLASYSRQQLKYS
ncbi:MAG: hypothetical protein MK105_02710 [Crocinitomicaceae bacterium]|nr:hypothetical protein [Crocinitomicaceae bacterium]